MLDLTPDEPDLYSLLDAAEELGIVDGDGDVIRTDRDGLIKLGIEIVYFYAKTALERNSFGKGKFYGEHRRKDFHRF